MCQGDDGALQKAVALVLQNREDFLKFSGQIFKSCHPFSQQLLIFLLKNLISNQGASF
jgi:hypothetical protein